jgi:hypothetical protein
MFVVERALPDGEERRVRGRVESRAGRIGCGNRSGSYGFEKKRPEMSCGRVEVDIALVVGRLEVDTEMVVIIDTGLRRGKDLSIQVEK